MSIFRAALAAADPADAVARHLARRNFTRFRHIYVIGAGKAEPPWRRPPSASSAAASPPA